MSAGMPQKFSLLIRRPALQELYQQKLWKLVSYTDIMICFLALKAKNAYYLALYKKPLPITELAICYSLFLLDYFKENLRKYDLFK